MEAVIGVGKPLQCCEMFIVKMDQSTYQLQGKTGGYWQKQKTGTTKSINDVVIMALAVK